MRRHSRLIAVMGGALAVCCFALTWVTFNKGSYERRYDTNVKTQRLGGATLRSSNPVTEMGSINPLYTSRHHRYPGYKIALGFNLVTVALIESVLILICSVIMLARNSSGRLKRIVIISSIIGILCLIVSLLFATMNTENGLRGLRSMGNTTYTAAGNIQLGGFGTAVGFVIALIGAICIPRESVVSRIFGDSK